MAERFKGFACVHDWSEVLSLGEQQRVAFARVFLTKPDYVILDEATSALELNNEEQLYHHLAETPTTFMSVGYRPTRNPIMRYFWNYSRVKYGRFRPWSTGRCHSDSGFQKCA